MRRRDLGFALLVALLIGAGSFLVAQLGHSDSISGGGTSIDAAACVTTTPNSLCTRVNTVGTTASNVSTYTTGIDSAACSTANAGSLCALANTASLGFVAPLLISTISREGLGVPLAATAPTWASNTAYASANRAFFYPITLSTSTTFATAFVGNGTVASGSFDVALYGATFSKLTSTTSSLMSGTSTIQNVALSGGAYTAAAGNYWLALAVDNGTATHNTASPTNLVTAGLLPMYSQNSAFPLPTTAAPVTTTNTRVMIFGLHNLPRSP